MGLRGRAVEMSVVSKIGRLGAKRAKGRKQGDQD
jgi:hypothetical protein